MTYTPEQLEAYRPQVYEDGIDNGHMAVIFLDALDVIKRLKGENETLRHYSKSCPCPHCLGCVCRKIVDCVNREEGNEVERLRAKLVCRINGCGADMTDEPLYCADCRSR